MGCWGIAETASEIEKIKAEMADYLHGLDSCGEIVYSVYSNLFDSGWQRNRSLDFRSRSFGRFNDLSGGKIDYSMIVSLDFYPDAIFTLFHFIN